MDTLLLDMVMAMVVDMDSTDKDEEKMPEIFFDLSFDCSVHVQEYVIFDTLSIKVLCLKK